MRNPAIRLHRSRQGRRIAEVPRRTFAFDPGGELHPFDARHTVDTSGLIDGAELAIGHGNAVWSTAYYGIAPSVFRGTIERVEELFEPDWSRLTFLDLGSGKGRALMLASALPFRRIVGIELAGELVETARANLARFSAPWQTCHKIEIREGDVGATEIPDGPLFVYLYNSFLPPVLRAFMANLDHSLSARPREVIFVYVVPEYREEVRRSNFFTHFWTGRVEMDVEDAEADRFYRQSEAVAIYGHRPLSAGAEFV